MSAGSSTAGSNAPILPMYDKTPLSHLLEIAVQKSYHELYTMADLYVFLSFFSFEIKSNLIFSLQTKTNLER